MNLIPSPDFVMDVLARSGAYREGHFLYPSGRHASHYFQMPLALREYDNARQLSVGLSRMFRMDKSISGRLPKVSIISPSPGGIMVAFGVREALGANQIYWAEVEDGKRQFRQFIEKCDIYPAIIVDDICRSGRSIKETYDLIVANGGSVIGAGAIVKYSEAPKDIEGVPIMSLLPFDVKYFYSEDEWKAGNMSDVPIEKVRVK